MIDASKRRSKGARGVARRFRPQLTYANVMSTIAVFIALGGSSYAVVTLDGESLENRSVRGVKVARNTLGSNEIRETRLAKVPRARIADRLGGFTAGALRVRCPTGTFPVAGACVETTARAPAPYGTARQVCAAVDTPKTPGRHLPTYDELVAALAAVPLAPGGELTNEVDRSPEPEEQGRLRVLYVKDKQGGTEWTPDTASGAKAFRCSAYPLN